jgi:hypothetical protein
MSLRNGEPYDVNEPEIPPPTEQEMKEMASSELKHTMASTISSIDMYNIGPDADPTTTEVLNGYRAEMVNLKSLPGSIDVINAECKRISDAVNDILDFQFRFESI